MATIILIYCLSGVTLIAPVKRNEARLKVDPATLWLLYGSIEGLSNSDLETKELGERLLESGKVREDMIETVERRSLW